MDKKIPDKIYEQILENTIISAVDAIIVLDGKVLLAKRTQEPCKNEWWIPGGRQFKGETPQEALKRKIKEEIGIDIEVGNLVNVYDVIFDKTAFPNVETGVHYIARVYIAKPLNSLTIELDKTQEDYKWVDKIEEDLDPYVKTALKDSKVFG